MPVLRVQCRYVREPIYEKTALSSTELHKAYLISCSACLAKFLCEELFTADLRLSPVPELPW